MKGRRIGKKQERLCHTPPGPPIPAPILPVALLPAVAATALPTGAVGQPPPHLRCWAPWGPAWPWHGSSLHSLAPAPPAPGKRQHPPNHSRGCKDKARGCLGNEHAGGAGWHWTGETGFTGSAPVPPRPQVWHRLHCSMKSGEEAGARRDPADGRWSFRSLEEGRG